MNLIMQKKIAKLEQQANDTFAFSTSHYSSDQQIEAEEYDVFISHAFEDKASFVYMFNEHRISLWVLRPRVSGLQNRRTPLYVLRVLLWPFRAKKGLQTNLWLCRQGP